MPLQWWVVGLILGAVSQLVRASDTGYGEGTIALSPGSLQCNFDRAYYGDYYFNGYKPSDDKILSCMGTYTTFEHGLPRQQNGTLLLCFCGASNTYLSRLCADQRDAWLTWKLSTRRTKFLLTLCPCRPPLPQRLRGSSVAFVFSRQRVVCSCRCEND